MFGSGARRRCILSVQTGLPMRHAVALLLLFACGARAGAEQNIAAPCVAGVSFWSLLGALDVGYADGHMRSDKLYAVCLPVPKAPSNSNFAYSPDEGGKLASVVKTADGQVLDTYVWYGENISGLWELSEYKVVGGIGKTLAPGNYTLEFQADGTPFYRFPFSVATAPSDDPYQPPGPRYFIDGPWSEYGNVFYQRNDPESSLRFTVWVQDRDTHAQHKNKPYAAQLLRVRDGKLIGSDKGELQAEAHWRQLDVLLHPEGEANAYLKAKDVLREDGTYRVRLDVDGKPYGTYEFTVSGGKIQVQGRQLESTDPTTRIVDHLYGGRYRSWWLPRQQSAISK
jgi:hypothetical protein